MRDLDSLYDVPFYEHEEETLYRCQFCGTEEREINTTEFEWYEHRTGYLTPATHVNFACDKCTASINKRFNELIQIEFNEDEIGLLNVIREGKPL